MINQYFDVPSKLFLQLYFPRDVNYPWDWQLEVEICLTKLTVKLTDPMPVLEKLSEKIYHLPIPNSCQSPYHTLFLSLPRLAILAPLAFSPYHLHLVSKNLFSTEWTLDSLDSTRPFPTWLAPSLPLINPARGPLPRRALFSAATASCPEC